MSTETSLDLSAGVAPRGLGLKVLGFKGLRLYSPRRVPYSFCVLAELSAEEVAVNARPLRGPRGSAFGDDTSGPTLVAEGCCQSDIDIG